MRWVLFLGVVAAAAAVQEPAPLQGDPARGRRVFIKKKCVECHAVLGSGGKVGPDLSQVGKGRSFYELVGQLWEHSPRMIKSMADKKVKWPTFKVREMADLISYLYYLNYFGKPGEYKKGKTAFTQKACVQCHSIGGRGGDRGPSLDTYGAAASPLKMVTAMWNHGPKMVGVQTDLNIETPRFDGSEVADILAYLRASTTKLKMEAEYLSPGDPQKGRLVFEKKKCATCHPVRGVGKGEGPDLAKANLRRSVAEIAGILWNHGPMIWKKLGDMGVAIAPFTVPEMTDLVSYLYFIEYYDSGGDAKVGEKLFHDRGCGECHSKHARESIRGPVLTAMKSTSNPTSLATAFWNHAPAMVDARASAVLPWPSFTETEMRNLAFYLRTARTKDKK